MARSGMQCDCTELKAHWPGGHSGKPGRFHLHAVSSALLFTLASANGQQHSAAPNTLQKSDGFSAASYAACKAVLEPSSTAPLKRPISAPQDLLTEQAEERLHALYCWMVLCGMQIDTAQHKRHTKSCSRGLKTWQWSNSKQQVAVLLRQLDASKVNKEGATKHLFPLTWRNTSNGVARRVVIKKYIDVFIRYIADLESSCGSKALQSEYQFYMVMSFWTDAAFMEFLRGMPGIPRLYGAAYDPLHKEAKLPLLMSDNLGKVALNSTAYKSLAQSHARELALSMMRMFQSLCDGGAFQMDQGPEQYMVTKRASDGQIDVWMVDSPFFLVGPVTKYQRKLSPPLPTRAKGKVCQTRSSNDEVWFACDVAAGYRLFPIATEGPQAENPLFGTCLLASLKSACCDQGLGRRDDLATSACDAALTGSIPQLAGVSGTNFGAFRRRFGQSESGREAMCRRTIVRLTVGAAVGEDFLLPELAKVDPVVNRVRDALLARLKVAAASDAKHLPNDTLAAQGITDEVLPPDLERLFAPAEKHRTSRAA